MAGPSGGIVGLRPGAATMGFRGTSFRTMEFGGGFSLATAGLSVGID